MTDRVILAVKFTPAGSASQVRRAVGGFLRYVQHRDLHPTERQGRSELDVSGLLKYVAYRDRASTRAELFGPSGVLTGEDRKAFAAFVGNALEKTRPQQFRGRDGQLRDRRRAVYRLVISPEHAAGLDLRRLTAAAVSQLEIDSGVSDLRWIAAVHRNTAHHHVHLVIAGMYRDDDGYHRVDLTKQRLAAMKEELALEIGRQRADRAPHRSLLPIAQAKAVSDIAAPSMTLQTSRRVEVRGASGPKTPHRGSLSAASVVGLRTVARRYQRRMEREIEEAYLQMQWEHAA